MSAATEKLKHEYSQLEAQKKQVQEAHLQLDMARGKPSVEQVDLSRPLLDVLNSEMSFVDEGVDAANYGAPLGVPSLRKLCAQLVGVPVEQLMIAGPSSLNIMHDCLTHAYVEGIGGNTPWSQQPECTFLCPTPGYDRHYSLCEQFGIHIQAIPLNADGPDMDIVEELVQNPNVKGLWCVPRFSNPTGSCYSDEVVRRIAALKPAAPDFRVFWDNAYWIHELHPKAAKVLNIFDELARIQAHNLVYAFGSFSKISFPGSSVAFVAADTDDFVELASSFGKMRVCSEKLMQLAHARYFKTPNDVYAHMKKHAALLAPKFRLVQEKLSAGLADVPGVTWTKPEGGYFVTLQLPKGLASRTYNECAALGLKLTPAAACFPYQCDPDDAHLRLAPSYPSLEELDQAMDILVLVVRMLCIEATVSGKD